VDYTGSVTFFTADMERHLGLMRRMRRLFRKRSQGKVLPTPRSLRFGFDTAPILLSALTGHITPTKVHPGF